MNRFAVMAVLFLCLGATTLGEWEAEYARLLKKYVTPVGVKYADWKASKEDMAAIENVAAKIGNAMPPAGSSPEALAFYINAYNAWILHEALEKYPTKSVKDPLFLFYTGDRIRVAGEKMSFNKLEKAILRKRFNEPRIRFALSGATRSDPPLLDEPYAGPRLNSQLEEQTRRFINSPEGMRVSGETWHLSRIFRRYRDDFGGEQKMLEFVNQYRNGTHLPKTVKYDEDDWRLNEVL